MKQSALPLDPTKAAITGGVATVLKAHAGKPVPDLTKPQLLTVGGLATILNISERHAENLIARGLIKTVPNLGRSVRIAPAEVLRFINAGKTDAGAA
jgi:helix-turn-helix protein